jgi:hypothetical protein
MDQSEKIALLMQVLARREGSTGRSTCSHALADGSMVLAVRAVVRHVHPEPVV